MKEFKILYATAKLANALYSVPLEHAHVDGRKEDRIAPFHRATRAVIHKAAHGEDDGGDDDDEIHRYFNRF